MSVSPSAIPYLTPLSNCHLSEKYPVTPFFLQDAIDLLGKLIGVSVLAFLASFAIFTDSYLTFPGLWIRLIGVGFVVSGLVWVARIESRKKAEREAGTMA
jgi:hypothetical protein